MDILITSLFLIVCVLLVIIVLLQRGRGGGLSASLGGGGGGGGGHSAFGSRTGDVFTWVTIILVAVFILLAVVATRHFRPTGNEQIATPIFTPAPKSLDRPTTINVAVPGGDGKEKVFYTLDGTEPTKNSPSYDAPVRVSPGQTLKAIAYRPGWRTSNVATGEYPVAGASRPSSMPASAAASMPAAAAPAVAH